MLAAIKGSSRRKTRKGCNTSVDLSEAYDFLDNLGNGVVVRLLLLYVVNERVGLTRFEVVREGLGRGLGRLALIGLVRGIPVVDAVLADRLRTLILTFVVLCMIWGFLLVTAIIIVGSLTLTKRQTFQRVCQQASKRVSILALMHFQLSAVNIRRLLVSILLGSDCLCFASDMVQHTETGV